MEFPVFTSMRYIFKLNIFFIYGIAAGDMEGGVISFRRNTGKLERASLERAIGETSLCIVINALLPANLPMQCAEAKDRVYTSLRSQIFALLLILCMYMHIILC